MERTPVDRGILLWEEIILWLPPSEVLPMRLVAHLPPLSRGTTHRLPPHSSLIDNPPTISYYLDLFSAGLEEGVVGDSLEIQDRRQKLEVYCSRWQIFDRAERTLLGPPPFPNVSSAYVDKGFLIYDEDMGDGKEHIYFVRLPSSAMGIPQQEWMIRGLSASGVRGHQRATYPPSNLLATTTLSDGGRYARFDASVAVCLTALARSELR